MKTYNKTKKAYSELLNLIKKYEDLNVLDYSYIENQSKLHLFGLELVEKYGFKIDPKVIYSLEYNKLDSYVEISLMGKEYGRTISWSDDGKQPNNEMLMKISFSSGAYIFGGDYPEEFFNEFFNELINLKPKYKDTRNRSLYFSMDNAGSIYDEFNLILKKYNELNKKNSKIRRIEKLKEELNALN